MPGDYVPGDQADIANAPWRKRLRVPGPPPGPPPPENMPHAWPWRGDDWWHSWSGWWSGDWSSGWESHASHANWHDDTRQEDVNVEQQDQNQDQVAPDNPADVTHDGDEPDAPESPEEPRPPSPRGPMNWLQDDEVLHLDGKLDYVSQSFVICHL